MNVVIDTNLFVSSFFSGNPKKIIDLCAKGEIQLCLTTPILDEYFTVLQRIGLKNEKDLKELISLFSHSFNSIFSAKTPSLNIVSTVPHDNKFIECAVALDAEYIISGDSHLRDIKKYLNI